MINEFINYGGIEMRWTNPSLVRGILSIVFLAVIVAAAACAAAPVSAPAAPPQAPPASPQATTPVSPGYTVNISNKAGVGDYLVDSKGMTLYYFTKDTNSKSNATAAIVQVWPVFYAASMSVPAPLKAGDFQIITRDDGTMQTTYLGWPLYYYAQDQAAGDTKGQGFNSVWFAVSPTGFMSAPAVPLPAPQPKTPQQYTN